MPPDKSQPTLLIFDGDVLAFTAAAAVQQALRLENGDWTQIARLEDGVNLLDGIITKLQSYFAAGTEDDETIIIISDPKDNWRYDIDPNYKANRKGAGAQKRPMLLMDLKDYLVREHKAQQYPRCEADDLAGILMTDPDLEAFNRILIGRDKDFKSIPGWHYQMPHELSAIGTNPKPFHITPEEAEHWHLVQSLAGDMTDNIPGCTNIGVVRAERLLEENLALFPEEGVITRGKNKGTKTVKWVGRPAESPWDVIVSNYQKVGLGENEALQTARLTHLLKFGEYDALTGEVTLWQPPKTTA